MKGGTDLSINHLANNKPPSPPLKVCREALLEIDVPVFVKTGDRPVAVPALDRAPFKVSRGIKGPYLAFDFCVASQGVTG